MQEHWNSARMGAGVTNPLRSYSFGGNEDFKQAEGAGWGLLGKPVDETVSFIIIIMYSFMCYFSNFSNFWIVW